MYKTKNERKKANCRKTLALLGKWTTGLPTTLQLRQILGISGFLSIAERPLSPTAKLYVFSFAPQLALQVLLQFDKAINSALAQRVRNRVNFRGSLNTYRFCDNVWTFVLNDVEFREVTELIKVDKVKIVACDGKNTGSNTTE